MRRSKRRIGRKIGVDEGGKQKCMIRKGKIRKRKRRSCREERRHTKKVDCERKETLRKKKRMRDIM